MPDQAPEHIAVPAPGVTDLDPEVAEHAEEELNFADQFYPARPRTLRPRVRRGQSAASVPPPFEAVASNPAYVDWLVRQSMLHDATEVSRQLTGRSEMWSNPYGMPLPRRAVDTASVWFTAYPISLITGNGESFLSALGSEDLWQVFKQIGIRAVHTGPVKLAGGIDGWALTPSIDGHFDRTSMMVDPLFGTEDEFRAMQQVAQSHGGIIIDDIVPGHTGKGADFRLATMNHSDYPGIYHMVSIPEDSWHLLPDVPAGQDSVNLTPEQELLLQQEGFIIGRLQRVIFYEPGVKETNWSATREILGVDGRTHRWVYLHYFKDGQPTIDWIDPTFAGMRLVLGDALHSILDLGAGGLRLDANGFLGVERAPEDDTEGPAWSEGHPLSITANEIIGSMVRKVGGFTFQELNLTIDAIAMTSESGPDLSYDFITRPAYHHAFVTGDTEFLRLTLGEGIRFGIDQASLVHALQNHDELTYELVHFATTHAHEEYSYRGGGITGGDLAEQVRSDLREGLTGSAGPYNAPFTQNGIACTTASIITAALGITDLDDAAGELERIRCAHLLLAAYNALQPGVFALSGWDLVGALPLDRDEVPELIAGGDTRWLSRGAHDLMGSAPGAEASPGGMPRARSLYGPLPEQMQDPDSFVSRLARMLRIRESHGISTGELLAVPTPSDPAVLILVNRLAVGAVQISVFNFSERPAATLVASEHLRSGQRVVDLTSDERIAVVEAGRTSAQGGTLEVKLEPFGFRALILEDS